MPHYPTQKEGEEEREREKREKMARVTI